jgi:hypothetical protein
MSPLLDPIQLVLGELLPLMPRMTRLTANPPLSRPPRLVLFRFGTNDIARRRLGRIRRVLLGLCQRRFQLRDTLLENRQTTVAFRTTWTALFLLRLRHDGRKLAYHLENHQDQFRIRERLRNSYRRVAESPLAVACSNPKRRMLRDES